MAGLGERVQGKFVVISGQVRSAKIFRKISFAKAEMRNRKLVVEMMREWRDVG